MTNKKIIVIILAFLLPILLAACSFPMGPKSGNSVAGVKGVFKTTDKGASWQEKNIYEGSEKSLGRFNSRKLAFDIFDSNILYRASEVGLFYSANGGDSWQLINALSTSDFVLNPKTRGLIYLVSGKEVYKTTDNGAKWQLIYSEVRPNITVVSVAVSYFDSSYIYLLMSDGALLISSDWGETWKTFYDFKQTTKKLFINPGNSQILFVGAERGLYRSLDQGKTWEEIVLAKNKDYPGIGEFRDLQFTAKGKELIYHSRYGFLKSRDNGNSWQAVTLITAPNTIELNSFGFNPKNTDELYYLIGNILYHTVNNGRNWETLVAPVPGGAHANQILVDSDNTDTLYLSITQ